MHFLDHIWTFMTDVVNVYIYSIILQILMNMVVHAEAFKSGLVSRVSPKVDHSNQRKKLTTL